MNPDIFKLSRQGLIVGAVLIVAVLLVSTFNSVFERVDAGESVVIQSVSGDLSVYTDPGYKIKLFGKATHYKKSFQFWFSKLEDQGSEKDDAIHVRFNDGGQARVSGSIRVDLPTDEKRLLDLHTTYGSQLAVEQQLVRTNVERAIFMTGPLMSSKESYAEKRNDLISDIEDQAAHGVYRTQTTTTDVMDPITGEKKTGSVVNIVLDKNGMPEREEESPLTRFGVHVYSMSINSVDYDEKVEQQIAAQQEATMQVQTAIANAKKAEQEALTVAKEGEAHAAKAKWDQETINAQVVAEAEGRRLAAEQDKLAAEFTKQKTILLAEGDAQAKKLLADANNNLDQRLDAYVKVSLGYADALKEIRVPLVPTTIVGGTGTANGASNLNDFISLLQAKTARDLSINTDLSPQSKKE